MQLYARHGDLVIEKKPATGELVATPRLVLAGSGDGEHILTGPVQSRRDGLLTFLRVGEGGATLAHSSRHLPISLEAGDYEVRPLRERGDGADRAVED